MSILSSVQDFESAEGLRAHYAALNKRLRPQPPKQIKLAKPVVIQFPMPVDGPSRWLPELMEFNELCRDLFIPCGIDAVRRDLGPITVRKIIKATARFYGVTEIALVGKCKLARFVKPRHVAMYLAREMTGQSMPDITRRLGRTDHTTVLHAVRKIDRLMRTDAQLATEVETIRADLS